MTDSQGERELKRRLERISGEVDDLIAWADRAIAWADRAACEDESSEPPGPRWLNVEDAAEYLRCPPSRIYDLVQLGRLQAHRDGRRLLFTRETLDAALEPPG